MAELKFALVTGAAHRVGRLLALILARQGYAILLHYHGSAEKAASTAREIEALGVSAIPVQADLSTDAGIAELIAAMDSHLQTPGSSLKVLVNSAAIMNRQDVRNLAPDDWDATFDLNLRAPFFLAQGAARRMAAGGSIINISDAGAGKPWTGFPAYTVSKAALESLTRLLARAYAPAIRVNAIAPGLVLPSERIPPPEWDRLVDRLPLGHPASESEMAGALEYLLANESVTGQIIAVDGGYSLI